MSIIQSLWIGDQLSVMEKLCISSFIKNGHIFNLYVYNDVKGIPDGVTIMDANKIIPSHKIFKYKNFDTYAGFANLFRYKLLLDKGGFWVDMDVVCLKKFDFTNEYIFTEERYSKKRFFRYNYHINNCIIKVPKGSEIMEYCYNESLKLNSQELKWGQTGPKLLTKAVKLFELNKFKVKTKVFYPIEWWNWKKFINPTPKKNILKNSVSVHLYNEMWRRDNVDKSAKFPETSIYEKLKKLYL